jgi:hypothetical protein
MPSTSNYQIAMHLGTKEETGFMRLISGLLISTLAVGTILTTGCAEHRYRNDPYAYGGYSGYYGQNDPYYREWLAERRYNYIEYNRLNSERQREYWEWRRANEARFRNDPRFRENQRYAPNGRYANDHDRDDRRRNDHDADDRGRTYARRNDHDADDRARTRNGDRDRHQADKDRHHAHKNRDKDKDRDHDRDHDRR